ncbi:BHMT [Cordylochernes scorpioides]|uniref:BHMT n=1 Tax=Cordylochernes scorpioides TaxID=51811 RepID=A0ABY6KUK7_9ARAC|nr:BHMT [Cordylochernes scorpioides]
MAPIKSYTSRLIQDKGGGANKNDRESCQRGLRLGNSTAEIFLSHGVIPSRAPSPVPLGGLLTAPMSLKLLLRCRLYLVKRSVTSSFHGPLQFREQEKVTEGQIWGIRWLRGIISQKKGLLERLEEGVVIGDGGFVFALEKRGYVKAGPWTPEAAVEHPEAVRQLHREFLRAGSDVMQAFTFYASDEKLINRGHNAGRKFTGEDINKAACELAHQVADEGGALVAGGLSQTPGYLSSKPAAEVKAEFRKQVDVFVKNNVDFLVCEYFEHVEEIEMAIAVCREASNLPVAATMCIGPEGDMHGVSAGDCAVRMAKAGAHVVGLNCHYDPFVMLDTIRAMKKALDTAGLKVHLMSQPLAYHTPDAGKQGFIDLPEFPFALEPRVCTRWDMHRYAREAYNLGVRYIGGCCGVEPYHIRAVAEELRDVRGRTPRGERETRPLGRGTAHTYQTLGQGKIQYRARRDYWEQLQPGTGRARSAAYSVPDGWGVTAGSSELKQHAEATSEEEQRKTLSFKSK